VAVVVFPSTSAVKISVVMLMCAKAAPLTVAVAVVAVLESVKKAGGPADQVKVTKCPQFGDCVVLKELAMG
jgi:hypothetical protein